MEVIKQQIEQCLLDTVGKYHSWIQTRKLEEVVKKKYNVFTANKQEEEKQTTHIKRKTEYTISTLNSMKKNKQTIKNNYVWTKIFALETL